MRRQIIVILLFATFTTIQAQTGATSGDARTIKADVMPTQATVTFNPQRIKTLGDSPVTAGSAQWEVCANTPLRIGRAHV